jgi:uncharacterized 2Fe-2S/4Fe-4S cluster protein (DUF4445 family)
MGATSKGTGILEQIIFSVKKARPGAIDKIIIPAENDRVRDEKRREDMKKLAAAICLAALAAVGE